MPSEEAVSEIIKVLLEACPDGGGPLADRAQHEQVQVDLPEVRPEFRDPDNAGKARAAAEAAAASVDVPAG